MAKNGILKTLGTAAKAYLGLGPNINVTSLSSASYSRDEAFGNSGWLFDQGGGSYDVHFSFSGLDDIIKAYEDCPPIYSIINQQAYAFTNGETKIMQKGGKGRGNEANNDWAKKVRALMKKPNPLANWKQFEAQAAIYLRLFGFCVIVPVKPAGFPMEDAKSLWIIPPYLCKIKESKRTAFNLKKGWIESIEVKYGEEKTTFTNMDDLIILRDITPGFKNSPLPGSPIKPLRQNINNLIGIYNSKGTLINYRGALGILTPEIDPQGEITMDPEEKEEVELGLMRYGLRSHQTKFIIANTAMKWQQMGVPYRDLMLTEWAEDDTMVCCDALVYPYKLLANNQSSSMPGNEVDAWKKKLYQDFVIPFACMIYEQLSDAFNADNYNCVILKCYDHVQALQEDGLKKAQIRKSRNDALLMEFYNNMLTLNRWCQLNDEEDLPGTMVTKSGQKVGDLYYFQLVEEGITFGKSGANVSIQQGETAGSTSTK